MDIRATPNLVHLGESGRRSLQLEHARGYRVVAVSGDVWVTQAGFIEDYILRPGQSVDLDSPGPAVVTSFGPADLEIIAPAAAAPFEHSPIVTAEAIERARSEASQLRGQAMWEAFDAAAGWVAGLAHRLVAAVTAPGAERAPCQHC